MEDYLKADARVIHSHEYTYRELIRRNFDQGVSQACHPEIFEKVKSEKEGIHLICTLVKKLLKERKYLQIIQLFVESGCKYLGSRWENITDNYRKVSS